MKPAIREQGKHLYEFGPFQLDCAERILAKAGERIPIAPKAFDTLAVLIEHRGHVLTKDELMKAVWPDSFVEENNLTQNISALRKVLGEGLGEQAYIETVPKLGYRFVAPVRDVFDESSELQSPSAETRVKVSEEATRGQHEEELTQAAISGQPRAFDSAAQTRFKLLGVTGFVFGLFALGLGAYWFFLGLRPAPIPTTLLKARRSVAVLGFNNLSRNPEAAWLSTALAEMLTTELAAGEQMRAISGEDVARFKLDLKLVETNTLSKATLNQIRNQLGADVTVSGSYIDLAGGSGEQIRFDVQLQDTASGETIGSFAEVGTVKDLFQLVSLTGTSLRTKLGVSGALGTETGELRASIPANSEVARLYSQGLSKLRAFDAPAAQELLTQAVTADPNYALGHSALAAAWSSLGYDQKAETEAKRALDLSENLSRQDHLLIDGRYREMTREWDKAAESYRVLFGFFPDNLDYGLRLSSAQTSAGKGVEALATVDKLRSLPPPMNQDPQIDLAEAVAAESLGDFKKELQTALVAAGKGEMLGERLLLARSRVRQAWALYRLGEPGRSTGVLEDAKRLFDATGDRQGAATALNVMANIFREQGNYAAAKQTGKEALTAFERIGDRRGTAKSLNSIAIIEFEQGHLPAAKQLYERSLAIQREVESKINTAGALGNIAQVLQAEGDLAGARKLTEESVKVFVEVGDRRALGTALGNLGDVLYEQGNLIDAKRTYEDALKIKSDIGYQRGVAFDLAGISRVLAAQGDTGNARKEQEEALAIRNRIGEKHNAASSMLLLAQLALDEEKPSEAERLATPATEQFRNDKSSTDEALGRIILGRALLAEDKHVEAQAAMNRAVALSYASASRPLRFELSLGSAYLKAASSKHVNRSAVEEIERILEASLTEAHRCGYLEYEFRLRLAMGEIDMKYGDQAAGRGRLETLRKETQAKQFAFMTQRAAAALGN
jgi:eukaryotic-like serine/threonine-protein kinase